MFKKLLTLAILSLALTACTQKDFGSFGAFGDPFISLQVGSSPSNGYILQTDGTDSTWVDSGSISSAFSSNWQFSGTDAITPSTTVGLIVNASSTINSNFRINGITTTTDSVYIEGSRNNPQLIVKEFSGQTTNLIEVQNASGVNLFDIESNGQVDIVHTATGANEEALEIDCFANGFGDTKCLDIVFKTGAIATGDDEVAMLVDLNASGATGGDVFAKAVLGTESSANLYGALYGATINPFIQLSGTFGNMDSCATTAGGNVLASCISAASDVTLFASDNNTLTIGDAAKFEEIEFLLATVASGAGIAPTFEFSTGIGTWTEFFPIDGTNGMRNNGEVVWLDSDIPTWAVGTGSEYLIRITRTRNSLTTAPVEDKIQITTVTEYSWNKDGDLKFRNATTTGNLTVGTLTSGRVTVASTAGLLADYAGLTFTPDTLTVTGQTTNANLSLIPVDTNDAILTLGISANTDYTQIIHDTDTSIAYLRNRTVDGDTYFGVTDTSLGLHYPLRLYNNNTVFNEEGADTDTRFEGDTDVNLLYLDAGNDRVGIGDATPAQLLTVGNGDLFTIDTFGNTTTTQHFNIGAPDTNTNSRGQLQVTQSTADRNALLYLAGNTDSTHVGYEFRGNTGNNDILQFRWESTLNTDFEIQTVFSNVLGTDTADRIVLQPNGGFVRVGLTATTTRATLNVVSATNNFILTVNPRQTAFAAIAGNEAFDMTSSYVDAGGAPTIGVIGAAWTDTGVNNPNIGVLGVGHARGGATVANSYGGMFSASSLFAAGTNYGVYIKTVTGGATNYGIYEESTAQNYFGGNVGIGDASPLSLFTVASGDLFQIDTSGAIQAQGGIPDMLGLQVQQGKVGHFSSVTGRAIIDASRNRWYAEFFDAQEAVCADYQVTMPRTYSSAMTLKADMSFTMSTTTSGNIMFYTQIMAVSGGDSASIETDSFATANTFATTATAGTVNYMKTITATLSNLDSLAAGDLATFRLCRDANNASDTADGRVDISLFDIYWD